MTASDVLETTADADEMIANVLRPSPHQPDVACAPGGAVQHGNSRRPAPPAGVLEPVTLHEPQPGLGDLLTVPGFPDRFYWRPEAPTDWVRPTEVAFHVNSSTMMALAMALLYPFSTGCMCVV
jgi:hypothetical protein